jgi:hypothetical protein
VIALNGELTFFVIFLPALWHIRLARRESGEVIKDDEACDEKLHCWRHHFNRRRSLPY